MIAMEHQHAAIPQRLAYSLAEVEVLTTLSRATISRAIASEKLHSIKRGRRRLIPQQALQDFLEQREA